MGSLSEHFEEKAFACRCGHCRDRLKISLTLIGILENVWLKFNQPLLVRRGFVCEEAEDHDETGPKRNYHGTGKAVDFTAQDAKLLPEIFRYLESFPEISGLGYDPDRGYIHIDLREKDPVKWLYQHREEKELTPELRGKHGLGEAVAAAGGRKSVTIDMPVEI
jgi:hypothetical protein